MLLPCSNGRRLQAISNCCCWPAACYVLAISNADLAVKCRAIVVGSPAGYATAAAAATTATATATAATCCSQPNQLHVTLISGLCQRGHS